MNLTELQNKAIKELASKRAEVLEEFARVYLAAIMPEFGSIEDAIKRIELVQQDVTDGHQYGTRWFYRLRSIEDVERDNKLGREDVTD